MFKALPRGPVVIIGSDVPGIGQNQVASAFRALGPGKAVIGPAEDGGYWSIGLPRGSTPLPRNLFDNVRWSGPHAMFDTIASLGNMDVCELEVLRDVDCIKDLQVLSSPRPRYQSFK